jgi:hypothetical protein
MKQAPLLGRVLLAGFVWIFFFAFVYLLLDALGVWQTLPPALTRAADLMTGAILAAELAGHIVLASGRFPDEPAPRNISG